MATAASAQAWVQLTMSRCNRSLTKTFSIYTKRITDLHTIMGGPVCQIKLTGVVSRGVGIDNVFYLAYASSNPKSGQSGVCVAYHDQHLADHDVSFIECHEPTNDSSDGGGIAVRTTRERHQRGAQL